MHVVGENKSNIRRPTLAALLLACVPFLAMCFSVPLWDRVFPLVLGLPFNLFWLMSWIPLTSACLWGAYRAQMRRRREASSEQKESAAE